MSVEIAEADALARSLMARHGLHDWELHFDRAKRRAGMTRSRDRVISLSAPLVLLHGEHDVRDTVLHEIAHALVGPRAGHGPVWREAAERVGARPQRCLGSEVPVVPGRWVGTCPRGHTVDRHRRPTAVVSCVTCSRSFDPGALLEWTLDGVPDPVSPRYQAQLRSMRNAPVASGASTGATTEGVRVDVGDIVVITAPGRWSGARAVVLKRARTRYHVKVGRTVVTVPFALVAATGARQER